MLVSLFTIWPTYFLVVKVEDAGKVPPQQLGLLLARRPTALHLEVVVDGPQVLGGVEAGRLLAHGDRGVSEVGGGQGERRDRHNLRRVRNVRTELKE